MRLSVPALLLFAALLPAAPLPLKFSGNKQIGVDDLYTALNLRNPGVVEIWEKPPMIEPEALSQSASAIQSFYRSKGYYHAKVDASQIPGELILTIEENAPIRIGTVTVNSTLDVGRAITLAPGDLFDQEAFSASKTGLKRRYAEAGYCNAQFNTKAWVDIETDNAYLLFEAEPGEPCTFGTVAAESTPNIDGKLVASMLRFDEGDPYSLQTIRQSYETLYAQEGISRILINDNDRNGSVVPITLDVEETQEPIRFSAGAGYSSDQGFTAQMGVKHRNFLGDLKTLAFNARYSQIRQEASGIFAVPFPNRITLSAEAGYKDETFDGYKTQSVYEKLTGKYVDYPASVLTGVLFDQINTYDSLDTATFPQTGLFITSPFAEINYDTRDNLFEPSRGYWLNGRLSGSVRSTAVSDATYIKPLFSGAYVTGWNHHILGAKLKWGTLRVFDGDVPASYRFYAGGMNSNRAYGFRELGPKNSDGVPIGFLSLIEGTVEYRFPVYAEFRGVLFADLTYASQRAIPDYAQDGYLGVGVGLRYVTPVGPVAVDFGIDPANTSQYAIHFRIGELF